MKNKMILFVKTFVVFLISMSLLCGCNNKKINSRDNLDTNFNNNLIESEENTNEVNQIDENNTNTLEIENKEKNENVQNIASTNKQDKEKSNSINTNNKKENTTENIKEQEQNVDANKIETKNQADKSDNQNKQNDDRTNENEQNNSTNNNNWKGMFEQPVKDCEITSVMYNRGEYHGGINYSIPGQKRVYAAADGEILYVKKVSNGRLRQPNGNTTFKWI